MARSRKQRPDVTAWLARYVVGPANVGNVAEPMRPTTQEERARDTALRTAHVRLTDATGRTYLVERPAEQPDAGA